MALTFCYLSYLLQTSWHFRARVELTEAMGFNVQFLILHSFLAFLLFLWAAEMEGQDKFLFEMDTKELGKELQI